MVMPKALLTKLEAKQKRRILDTVSIPFVFNLDNDDVKEFSVGCSNWTITCFFDDYKEQKSDKATPAPPEGGEEGGEAAVAAAAAKAKKPSKDQKFLFVKITSLTDLKNFKILTFGSIALQPTEPPRHAPRTPDSPPTCRQKFDYVFTNLHLSQMISNFAPREYFNGKTFVRNNSFTLALKFGVRSFNVTRVSPLDLKKPIYAPPRTDLVLAIEKEDRDYEFCVNKQYVSMHSDFLKECIKKAPQNLENVIVGDLTLPRLVLADVEPVELRDFLNITYPSALKLQNGHLPSFLKLSEKFKSAMVKELCSTYLMDNMIRFKNDQLLRFSDKYGLMTLKARILKMIDTKENFESVRKACDSGKLSLDMKKLVERKEKLAHHYGIDANQALKDKPKQGPRGVSKKRKLLKKSKSQKNGGTKSKSSKGKVKKDSSSAATAMDVN